MNGKQAKLLRKIKASNKEKQKWNTLNDNKKFLLRKYFNNVMGKQ